MLQSCALLLVFFFECTAHTALILSLSCVCGQMLKMKHHHVEYAEEKLSCSPDVAIQAPPAESQSFAFQLAELDLDP